MNDSSLPRNFGLVLFSELATHCLKEDEAENKYLEGLCPERISLSENWFAGDTKAEIKPAEAPYNAYAYYAPEYLQGKPWTAACTSFTLFSITYKLLTGELPYWGLQYKCGYGMIILRYGTKEHCPMELHLKPF